MRMLQCMYSHAKKGKIRNTIIHNKVKVAPHDHVRKRPIKCPEKSE